MTVSSIFATTSAVFLLYVCMTIKRMPRMMGMSVKMVMIETWNMLSAWKDLGVVSVLVRRKLVDGRLWADGLTYSWFNTLILEKVWWTRFPVSAPDTQRSTIWERRTYNYNPKVKTIVCPMIFSACLGDRRCATAKSTLKERNGVYIAGNRSL